MQLIYTQYKRFLYPLKYVCDIWFSFSLSHLVPQSLFYFTLKTLSSVTLEILSPFFSPQHVNMFPWHLKLTLNLWTTINIKCFSCNFFTSLLSLFTGTDEESVILNAFAQYDEGDGTCKEELWVHFSFFVSFNSFFLFLCYFLFSSHLSISCLSRAVLINFTHRSVTFCFSFLSPSDSNIHWQRGVKSSLNKSGKQWSLKLLWLAVVK